MAKQNKNQKSKHILQDLTRQSASEILKRSSDMDSTDDDDLDYDDLYDEDDEMERINNNIRKKMKRGGY